MIKKNQKLEVFLKENRSICAFVNAISYNSNTYYDLILDSLKEPKILLYAMIGCEKTKHNNKFMELYHAYTIKVQNQKTNCNK